MSTKLLLAQDHALFRTGVRHALELAPGMSVVAETGIATEVLNLTRRTQPDAVLLGFEMQGQPTVTYLERVRAGASNILVIVIAEPKQAEDAASLYSHGAASVILTTIELDDLAPAIHAVIGGTRGEMFGASPPVDQPPGMVLTPRELDTLRILGAGLSNRAIATTLSVSEHTVKFHLTSVYQKLNVRSRTEAANWAVEHGLVTRAFTGARNRMTGTSL